MVEVDKAVIARIKKGGKHFEILVDCDKALEFKKGKGDIDDVLAVTDIYEDVKKGLKASENKMKDIFGTDNYREVAEIIVREGDVQVTKDHMAKEREELKKQIIGLIHRNAVDSKTGLPHPMKRIEIAWDDAKINVDMSRTAENQLEIVIDKLRVLLPIKFEKKRIEIKVPTKYGGRIFGVLKKYGQVSKNEWQSDGFLAVVEIPAGIQEEFFTEINNLCHGDVQSKILE